MRLSCLGVLLAGLLTNLAVARDIYVNNVGGDDRHNGGAPTSQIQGGGPMRTIERALRAARKGDRIILAKTAEPYRESITLQGGNHSGNPYSPFVLVGNGAILEGARPVPADAWQFAHENVFRFQPRLLSYQQLFLDGKPAIRRAIEEEGKLPKLKELEWCLFERQIYFAVEDDRLPQSYNLTHADQRVGVTLYEVRNIVISDLIVQGFQLDGINAHDGVFDGRIVGCVSRGNGRSGVSIGGASRVVVESCLVGNNGKAQIRTEGFSHTRVMTCDLLENPAPKILNEGGKVEVIENATAD